MGWMSPEISDLDDTYLDFLMRHLSGGCLEVNQWCSQNSLQVGNPQAGTCVLKLDSCQKWVCLWIKYAKMPWTLMDPHGLSPSFQLGGNFGYTYPWCVKVISQIQDTSVAVIFSPPLSESLGARKKKFQINTTEFQTHPWVISGWWFLKKQIQL